MSHARNGREWTENDIAFLKANFGKMHPSIIANKLVRTENTVRHRAYGMGLQSERTIRINKKRDIVTDEIKNGVDCPLKLAKLSGLSKDTCYKMLLTIKTEKKAVKNLIEKTEGAYFSSEQEILTSLDPIYKAEELNDWEKYQLKQSTPKGFDCPKLHTKQLNTFKL